MSRRLPRNPIGRPPMDHPRRTGRAVLRHLAAPALALAVAATLPATASRPGPAAGAPRRAPARPPARPPGPPPPPPRNPASVSYGAPPGPAVRARFSSNTASPAPIAPPAGSGAAVNGVPAGGVEYLATWLKK